MTIFTVRATGCGLSYGTTFDWRGDAYLGNDGNPNYCGLYFPTIAIPLGASVLASKITYTAYDALTADTVRVKYKFQDAYNPANFVVTETNAQFLARARSSENVAHVFTTDWVAGSTYDSTDLSVIFQAHVLRSWWVSGGGIVVFVEDDGSIANAYRDAYQLSDATKGPLLTIEYGICRFLRTIEKY